MVETSQQPLRFSHERAVMRIRTLGARRRGVAAVEMALVASFILVPAAYGMIEMSRAIQVQDYLSCAARSGCAVAVRPGKDNAAVNANISTVLATYGISSTLVTVTITVNGVTADVSTAVQNDKIALKISLPASQVNYMMPLFMAKTAVQSETLVMMRQG